MWMNYVSCLLIGLAAGVFAQAHMDARRHVEETRQLRDLNDRLTADNDRLERLADTARERP